MKDIRVVSWKLPPRECLANIFAKFSPSENNHVYNNYYRLSANISLQTVLYYDNIVLLRYNRWRASDNIRELYDWIKLIHV